MAGFRIDRLIAVQDCPIQEGGTPENFVSSFIYTNTMDLHSNYPPEQNDNKYALVFDNDIVRTYLALEGSWFEQNSPPSGFVSANIYNDFFALEENYNASNFEGQFGLAYSNGQPKAYIATFPYGWKEVGCPFDFVSTNVYANVEDLTIAFENGDYINYYGLAISNGDPRLFIQPDPGGEWTLVDHPPNGFLSSTIYVDVEALTTVWDPTINNDNYALALIDETVRVYYSNGTEWQLMNSPPLFFVSEETYENPAALENAHPAAYSSGGYGLTFQDNEPVTYKSDSTNWNPLPNKPNLEWVSGKLYTALADLTDAYDPLSYIGFYALCLEDGEGLPQVYIASAEGWVLDNRIPPTSFVSLYIYESLEAISLAFDPGSWEEFYGLAYVDGEPAVVASTGSDWVALSLYESNFVSFAPHFDANTLEGAYPSASYNGKYGYALVDSNRTIFQSNGTLWIQQGNYPSCNYPINIGDATDSTEAEEILLAAANRSPMSGDSFNNVGGVYYTKETYYYPEGWFVTDLSVDGNAEWDELLLREDIRDGSTIKRIDTGARYIWNSEIYAPVAAELYEDSGSMVDPEIVFFPGNSISFNGWVGEAINGSGSAFVTSDGAKVILSISPGLMTNSSAKVSYFSSDSTIDKSGYTAGWVQILNNTLSAGSITALSLLNGTYAAEFGASSSLISSQAKYIDTNTYLPKTQQANIAVDLTEETYVEMLYRDSIVNVRANGGRWTALSISNGRSVSNIVGAVFSISGMGTGSASMTLRNCLFVKNV